MNRRYRKTVIAGNWKMNMTATETKKFAEELKKIMPRAKWCDTLISCQDDSQLIGTLYSVVEKLTDMRIVNAELKVMISENKREYYIMALMVVANIPLLYFLNKEWYGALMYTTFGKVTLAICGAVMLFTFLRMQKYCKPVEYRR